MTGMAERAEAAAGAESTAVAGHADVAASVLGYNDRVARALRERLHGAGVVMVNLVSSPGSGKTRLLEELLRRMGPAYGAAALVGDLATDNDAQRLARSGAPVRQVSTEGLCHLEATMIQDHLIGWDVGECRFLFVENVGNLVCPASFDLGEAARIVFQSTTEGEDKPLKYPPMYSSADLAVITKIDLAEAVEFDRAACRAAIRAVNPGVPIVETSAKTGDGVDDLVHHLVHLRDHALGLAHEHHDHDHDHDGAADAADQSTDAGGTDRPDTREVA